jgi:hypothetical protein
MSCVQLGTPENPVCTPAEICLYRLSQVPTTSPDHKAAAWRCTPAKPERVRMKCRASGRSRIKPSCTAWLLIVA